MCFIAKKMFLHVKENGWLFKDHFQIGKNQNQHFRGVEIFKTIVDYIIIISLACGYFNP
jgi:hypothetical protein